MRENTSKIIGKDKSLRERKVMILLGAEALFAEKGYSATTVRDLAASILIHYSLIYKYFGSKEKLLFAIVSNARKNLNVFGRKMIFNAPSDSLVRQFLDLTISFVFRNPNRLRVLYQILSVSTNDILKKQTKEIFATHAELLYDLSYRGRIGGIFTLGAHPINLYLFLCGTIEKAIRHWELSEGKHCSEENEFFKSIADFVHRKLCEELKK